MMVFFVKICTWDYELWLVVMWFMNKHVIYWVREYSCKIMSSNSDGQVSRWACLAAGFGSHVDTTEWQTEASSSVPCSRNRKCTCAWTKYLCCVVILCRLFYYFLLTSCLHSVLWRCWLGGRKGIWPVKNWVVGCWHGYLSGARCRLVHGPADATASDCPLLQWNPDWFYLSGTGHPGSPGKRAVKRVCVCNFLFLPSVLWLSFQSFVGLIGCQE